MNIASTVASARQKAGMTQGELAEKLGVTQGYVSQIERGRHEGMSVRQLSRVLEACGRTMTDEG